MTRNLQQRIEVCIPVTDENLKIDLSTYFDIQWNDNSKAVMLDAGLNEIRPDHSEPASMQNPQQQIYEYLKN